MGEAPSAQINAVAPVCQAKRQSGWTLSLLSLAANDRLPLEKQAINLMRLLWNNDRGQSLDFGEIF